MPEKKIARFRVEPHDQGRDTVRRNRSTCRCPSRTTAPRQPLVRRQADRFSVTAGGDQIRRNRQVASRSHSRHSLPIRLVRGVTPRRSVGPCRYSRCLAVLLPACVLCRYRPLRAGTSLTRAGHACMAARSWWRFVRRHCTNIPARRVRTPTGSASPARISRSAGCACLEFHRQVSGGSRSPPACSTPLIIDSGPPCMPPGPVHLGVNDAGSRRSAHVGVLTRSAEESCQSSTYFIHGKLRRPWNAHAAVSVAVEPSGSQHHRHARIAGGTRALLQRGERPSKPGRR